MGLVVCMPWPGRLFDDSCVYDCGYPQGDRDPLRDVKNEFDEGRTL